MEGQSLESNREEANKLLPEERNLYITRIEFLGNTVRMHWIDQETSEHGYTEISYETYIKQFRR